MSNTSDSLGSTDFEEIILDHDVAEEDSAEPHCSSLVETNSRIRIFPGTVLELAPQNRLSTIPKEQRV